VLTWDDYVRYVATLPHEPMWNLIPRCLQPVPCVCDWHGTVDERMCAECRREYDEYRETGTWTQAAAKDSSDERGVSSP
jgi:hypothetical protein